MQTAKERAKLISQVNELFTNYFDFQSFIDQDKKFTKDTKDTEITAAILLEQSFTNVMLFLQTIDEDCVAEKDANGIKSSWNEKLFASTMYFANFLKPSPKTKAKTKPKPKPGPGLIGFFKRVLNKKEAYKDDFTGRIINPHERDTLYYNKFLDELSGLLLMPLCDSQSVDTAVINKIVHREALYKKALIALGDPIPPTKTNTSNTTTNLKNPGKMTIAPVALLPNPANPVNSSNIVAPAPVTSPANPPPNFKSVVGKGTESLPSSKNNCTSKNVVSSISIQNQFSEGKDNFTSETASQKYESKQIELAFNSILETLCSQISNSKSIQIINVELISSASHSIYYRDGKPLSPNESDKLNNDLALRRKKYAIDTILPQLQRALDDTIKNNSEISINGEKNITKIVTSTHGIYGPKWAPENVDLILKRNGILANANSDELGSANEPLKKVYEKLGFKTSQQEFSEWLWETHQGDYQKFQYLEANDLNNKFSSAYEAKFKPFQAYLISFTYTVTECE